MNTLVYICENTPTGVFSAIYDIWKLDNRENCRVVFKGHYETELFCEYIESVANERKAAAIQNLIIKNLGEEAYKHIYYASLANDLRKGDAILGTLLAALLLKQPTYIMENLANPFVKIVFDLYTALWREDGHLKGFVRFRELASGILFATVTPRHQILPCLAPHFTNRLPLENWLIYDTTNNMYAVHEAKKEWVYLNGDDLTLDTSLLNIYSDKEIKFEELWDMFVHTIAIDARKNPDLRRQMFPLHYRTHAVESFD